MDKTRFVFVDALRGLAALSVVLFHAVEGGHIPQLFAAMPHWLQVPLEHGDVGVAIFFVLSGFVIAHSLRSSELTWVDVGRFMLRRSIRLDPPYWIAILVAISFSVLASKLVKDRAPETFSASQILSHVFYLQGLLGIKNINPVFWTLCFEIQFYAVYALMLLTRSKVVIIVAFCVSLIWPLGLAVAPVGLFVELWFGFLLGVGAYFSWLYPKARPWFLLYVAALLATANLFAVACCVTALALLGAGISGQMTAMLNWRWLQFLGSISYSLYLLHNPITGAAFRAGYLITGKSMLMEALWWVVSLLCCIGAAALLWVAVERPSTRLAKVLIGTRRAGLAQELQLVERGSGVEAESTPAEAAMPS